MQFVCYQQTQVMKIAMNVVGAFTTGGRGWNRTIGVSCVTGLQPAAFAARRTRPYKSVGFFSSIRGIAQRRKIV